MKAYSINTNSVDGLKQRISELPIDFRPTLAVVFLSVSMDRKAITELLTQREIKVFGITTNGEFVDEDTQKHTASILLLDLNPDFFRIYLEKFDDNNYKQVGHKIGETSKSVFNDTAFILGISGASTDGEAVLRGLQAAAGNDITAFGGAAGDDYAFKETFVFTNNQESNNAVLCLSLNEEKVKVEGIASCGWKAVGTEKTVTKSEGNHVYTINGIPAAEITAKYGGLDISPEKQETLMELAANFPIQLIKENGDTVMRPGLVVDWDDMSFYTSGNVPQGSKVRFSLPPDWDVMEEVVRGVEKLKETKMPEAEALIIFSCAGRLLSFGPMMNDEIKGIKNVWNVPMVGMFSNAELGRTEKGNLEMHNITTCTIALKEISS